MRPTATSSINSCGTAATSAPTRTAVQSRIACACCAKSCRPSSIPWVRTALPYGLSPNGESQGVDDSNQAELFPAAAAALDRLGIVFLELREPGPDGTFGKSDRPPVAPLIRKAFKGILVLNSDYDLARGQAAVGERCRGCDYFRKKVPGESRSSLSLRKRSAAEYGRSENLVLARTRGLYHLSSLWLDGRHDALGRRL